MKTLVILRGCPGVGKSTWIKENELEPYTICADTLRLLHRNPVMNINNKDSISQYDNKQIWSMLYYLVEEKMKHNDFIIVDATHSDVNQLSTYKQLGEKYRYRLLCVEFSSKTLDESKDILYNRIIAQNSTRSEYKQVPRLVLDRMFNVIEDNKVPSYFKTISSNEFLNNYLKNYVSDLSSYNNIHIIGDIHGCYEPLKEYICETTDKVVDFDIEYTSRGLASLLSSNDAYIFVGDYFDRGIENVEVFKLLNIIKDYKNVTLLIGNHEEAIREYAFMDSIKNNEFRKTIKQFEEAGITKADLREFYRRLNQLSFIKIADKSFIITHGGIPDLPKLPLLLYSSSAFINGIGAYEEDIDSIFEENTKDKPNLYQIHGHRNSYNVDVKANEKSYNLEGQVEYGGYLRAMRIDTKGNIETYEIKNDKNVFGIASDNVIPNDFSDYIVQLRNNKFIKEKQLADGISSFNFSREAFEKGIWSNMTTKARGLFIDTINNKIQARSYDKFFRNDERKETKIENLIKGIKFPVSYFIKYNGFLGILSVKNNDLYYCSKSTDSGEHVDIFKSVLEAQYSKEQLDNIKQLLIDLNATAVFEVMDMENDPHIIDNPNKECVLLDVIKNTIQFECLDYSTLKTFAEKYNIKVKELAFVAYNEEDLLLMDALIKKQDFMLLGKPVEGFVAIDSNGFMLKYKTYYYNLWKYMRNILSLYLKDPYASIKYNIDNKELCKAFHDFLKEKYPYGDKDRIANIIEERKDFEEKVNKSIYKI